MPELQRLNAGHAPAVLTFELANRAYFAASISDRGDEFFKQFADRYGLLLAEQEAGVGAFYVLVAEDGSVLGRFNLIFAGDGTAELGYRVAQHAAGRGVATATVRELCRLASARHGLRTLKAAASSENAASRKVLTKTGFVEVGPADPAHLGGKPGTWYQRDLATADSMDRLLQIVREHSTLCLDVSGPGWDNARGYLYDPAANVLYFPVSASYLKGRSADRYEVLIWSQPRLLVVGRLSPATSDEDAGTQRKLAAAQGMDADTIDNLLFDRRNHKPRKNRHKLVIESVSEAVT